MNEYGTDREVSVVEISTARRVSRWPAVVTLVAVLFAGGVVTVALAFGGGGEGSTASARLAAAQAYVAGVETYRYDAVFTDTIGSPEDMGPGTTSTMRTHISVDVAAPDHWRSRSDSGDWMDESIQIGERFWERYAEAEDGLDEQLWVEVPADAYEFAEEDMASFAEEMGDAGVGASLGVLWFGQDPASTVELITGATDPKIIGEGNVTTLALTPPPVPELEPLDVAITLELDLDPGDVPLGLRIAAGAGGDDHAEIVITFTGWDVPVTVDPPADDQIDRTPWVDEEAVLAYSASKAYAPSRLPEGYELVGFGTWEADPEWGECAQVVLEYGRVPSEAPTDLDGWDAMMNRSFDERISVTSEDPSCDRGDDDDVLMTFGDAGMQQVDLDGARVLVDVGRFAPPMDEVVSSLAPVDLAELLEPFNARQAELEAMGLGMAGGLRFGQ